MQITILCVGKIKEAFYRDAVSEYIKRLSRYCKLSIIEVADEMTPDNASDVAVDQIKKREGERIIAKLPENAYIITLEIDGKNYSSEEFAKKIQKTMTDGYSHIVFIIGGSLGLHRDVIAHANEHLSFSNMTFPHQLMRVILSEQIYRAFRIINHEPYHK